MLRKIWEFLFGPIDVPNDPNGWDEDAIDGADDDLTYEGDDD